MPGDAPSKPMINKTERLVVLGGIGIHFVLTLAVFRSTFKFVSEGGVSVFGGLAWVVGLACLYLAALKVARGKTHPTLLLGLAAACLAFSSFRFGWTIPPGLVAALGALIAVAGIVVVHPLLSGRTAGEDSTPPGGR